MRHRVSYLFVTLAVLGAGAAAVGRAAADCSGPCPLTSASKDVGQALRSAGTAVERAIVENLVPGSALAQVLDFKPVPRESVARFDRMRVVKRRAALDSLDIPDEPDEPDAPAVPSPPRGNVDRSGGIMRIGSDIVVGKDEVIEGDLSSLSGDITIEGHVEGDVVAMKGDVTLKSTAQVDGDVVCLGGSLTEEPGAQVSGQKVTAPVHGFWRDRGLRRLGHEGNHEGAVASALVWMLVLLLFGWVFTRFLEGRSQAAVDTLHREPGLSLGIGSLIWALIIPSIIALVLVVALLCITIIGIPLALAALLGYFLFLAILALWGFTVGAIFLGGGLSKRSQSTAAVAPPGPPLPGPSLMKSMVVGVTALIGASVVGHLLRSIGDIGPLRGFGTLIVVMATLGSLVAMTVGAGALLRTEILLGTFQRIWSGRRSFRSGPAPAMAPAGAVPVPAPVEPPPPPPPSPPTSFQPPAPPPPPPVT